MKTLALALLFFAPNLFAAGFDGRFQGTGTSLMHKTGNVRPCSEIFLQFKRSTSGVNLLAGGYACEDLQASFPTFFLEIRDGKLYDGKALVGTFTEERLEIAYEDADENFTYHWLLELKDGKLNYLEEWTDAGAPALTVRGLLTPK